MEKPLPFKALNGAFLLIFDDQALVVELVSRLLSGLRGTIAHFSLIYWFILALVVELVDTLS